MAKRDLERELEVERARIKEAVEILQEMGRLPAKDMRYLPLRRIVLRALDCLHPPEP